MPSPQLRGYSLELKILLYSGRRNGKMNSYDAFNISAVMLSISGDLLLFKENITRLSSYSEKFTSKSLSKFTRFTMLSVSTFNATGCSR